MLLVAMFLVNMFSVRVWTGLVYGFRMCVHSLLSCSMYDCAGCQALLEFDFVPAPRSFHSSLCVCDCFLHVADAILVRAVKDDSAR